MNVRVTLEGADELVRTLRRMGRDVGRAVDQAAREGTQVIAQDATGRAGTRIEVELEERGPNRATYAAGPPEDKWHLRFLEFGAQPHEITGSPLAFEGERGAVVTGRVEHPGMAARPFLRPAFDTQKDKAVGRVGDVLMRAIL